MDNIHHKISELLEAQLIKGVLPHAHLFVGPEGVGRTDAARSLAESILCSGDGERPCGQCRSCSVFSRGQHPDYHEFATPEGRQSLPIESIRELQLEASRKPFLGDKRVFVIRDAERMTVEAANCFLKTLEEPPGECYLILIATGLSELPETVVSRCQVAKLTGASSATVSECLSDVEIGSEDAAWLAGRSWGSPGRMRKFYEQALHEFNRTLIDRLLVMKPEDNFKMSFFLQDSVGKLGSNASEQRWAAQELLECLAMIFRDIAALTEAPDAALFNEDRREELALCAENHTLDSALDCADKVLEAIERINANSNRRLVMDDLFSYLSLLQCEIPETTT